MRTRDIRAPRTVPGLQNARDEDEDDDDEAPEVRGEGLNWWQASNVQRIREFMKGSDHDSDGMVLCDAPGIGKTLSVLSTVAVTLEESEGRAVLIFAGKGIVPQWASQVLKHFEPEDSGLQVYCADSELWKFAGSTPLSERAEGAEGGVFVDDRPSALLPGDEVLKSFDVIVLAKEILSQNGVTASVHLKNIVRVQHLRPHLRLVVVDESQNYKTKAVSKSQINLDSLVGVPKLLLSGTPGTSPSELYEMLKVIRHKTLLTTVMSQAAEVSAARQVAAKKGSNTSSIYRILDPEKRKAEEERRRRMEGKKPSGKQPAAAAAAASAPAAAAPQLVFLSEHEWRARWFEPKTDDVLAHKREELITLLNKCFLHTPKSAAKFPIPIVRTERVPASSEEVRSYNFALSLHKRDVLRSSREGRKAEQPDEWQYKRPSKDWYTEKKKRSEYGPVPPSGEKTIGDLMRAANGGEHWELSLPAGVDRDR